MPNLPPLECLRYFEIAARHESFARAAKELGVTSAAVAYRVKVLEEHLGRQLFERQRRSVTLNNSGKACLSDVQRVLAEIGEITERYGPERTVRRLSVAAAESIADRWLMPKLHGFHAIEPDVVIAIETNLEGTDTSRRDVDLWITYAGEANAPDTPELHCDTLFEERLFPVCSPAMLEARSPPSGAADLHRWPLLYHLERPSDWLHWFAVHRTAAPDLSNASGFRLCSMLLQAAVDGMGVAIGHASIMNLELQQGKLQPLFANGTGPRTRCCLVSNSAARSRAEVRAFRDWILQEAAA